MMTTRTHVSSESEEEIIRLCQVWARMNPVDSLWENASEVTVRVLKGRPYFHIDPVLTALGWEPRGKDYEVWNVVRRWMYGRGASKRTAPIQEEGHDE